MTPLPLRGGGEPNQSAFWRGRIKVTKTATLNCESRQSAITGNPKNASEGSPLLELGCVLQNSDIHVWYADLAAAPAAKSLYCLLDEKEHQRASLFKVRAAHDEFVTSRAFLRLAIGCYLEMDPPDVRFRVTEQGKPELAGPSNIRFNLTHTEGAAALAITRVHAVGIDIERIRQDIAALEIADSFFSRIESEWLHSQPRSQLIPAFFACWTAKEACVKACGRGFSMPLHTFSVAPRAPHNKLEFQICGDLRDPVSLTIRSLKLGPEIVGAVAVEGNGLRLRVGKWPWA